MTKLLVLFVFHKYDNRVIQFIEKCIFKDKNVDFIIISNNYSKKFYYPDYVKFLLRENKGYDFGGWSDGLLTNNLYKDYDNFIFVNSSVNGPYLDSDYKGKWTDIYINGLQNNVKLFGSTINTMATQSTPGCVAERHFLAGDVKLSYNPRKTYLPYAHVQSYIFSMNKETLEYLIECNIFSNTKYTNSLKKTVFLKEILMSRRIIEKKWNIGSLLKCYKGVDFTFSNKKPSDYNIRYYNDIMQNSARNRLWKLNEVVFIKGRGAVGRVGRGVRDRHMRSTSG